MKKIWFLVYLLVFALVSVYADFQVFGTLYKCSFDSYGYLVEEEYARDVHFIPDDYLSKNGYTLEELLGDPQSGGTMFLEDAYADIVYQFDPIDSGMVERRERNMGPIHYAFAVDLLHFVGDRLYWIYSVRVSRYTESQWLSSEQSSGLTKVPYQLVRNVSRYVLKLKPPIYGDPPLHY
jgi:hypothetical protein